MNAFETRETHPDQPGAYSFHRTAGPTPNAPTRLGVLDLGSNTFHLAVADVGAEDELTLVSDPKESVQLVSALEGGAIDEPSWARARRALRFLVRCARGFDDLALIGVATGAFRSAANGAAFVEAARREHRMPIEILSGLQEARLAFAGACSELPPPGGPAVVLDLGGGSAELAVGWASECRMARSLPLGVLRLRHRHVAGDGVMTADDARTVGEAVTLAGRGVTASLPPLPGSMLLLTGGTARAIARLLHDGDPAGIRIERRHVEQLARHVAGRTPDALIRLGVEPTRADTIGPGSVAIATWMALLGFEAARVCQRGLREGVLLRELRRRRADGPVGDGA